MSVNKKNKSIILFLLGIFCLLPIIFTNSFAAQYEVTNYVIIQSLIFWLLFLHKENRYKFLLSPSILAVTYLNLNFLIGSWVFKNDLVFTKLRPDYELWEYASVRLVFFNLMNFFIILSYYVKIKYKYSLKYMINLNKVSPVFIFYTTVASFLLLLIIAPYLAFIGVFVVIFKTALALIIISFAFKYFSLKKRVVVYFSIIFIFVLFSTQSKREAVFLILPIFLLESSRLKLKLGLKQIFVVIVAGFTLCYFILTMSILRNYGGFKPKGFFDAATYVDDYVKTNNFTAALMNNLEISSTYLHSNNVIEYLKKDKLDYVYGETLIKPIFIFFPRSIFKFKPRSSIDIYTLAYDKEFRNKGGSFPVSIQSELYLNFGFLSLIVGFVAFVIFNNIFFKILDLIKNNKILNNVYLLYMYMIFLVLIRGSGLDIFTVYSIFFITFFLCYKIFLKGLHAFYKLQ